MEHRSPYVAIGATVLVFILAVVGFVVWKLRAGSQENLAYYRILYDEDVQGLTRDSPVYYRGLRVGRVQAINLVRLPAELSDAERVQSPDKGARRMVERISVVVGIDRTIDIHTSARAVFERPLITGAAYIQIVAGMGPVRDDAELPKRQLDEEPFPEIVAMPSTLQSTAQSAQELFAKASTLVDRLNTALSADAVAAFNDSLKNLSTLTTSLARNEGNLDKALAELPRAITEMRGTMEKFTQAADTINLIALEIGPQDEQTRKALAGKTPSEVRRTLSSLREAVDGINATTASLNRMVADNRGPVRQFTEQGLVELNATIRELKSLSSNLNAISTRLERDPANYLFGSKQGYQPK
ncbi:MAG: MCE family protein [Alphaproteobacteria bacterium]|nr:MCE family protein [Alphaproteobacteria bacterium]MCW5744386.1 MCE family protein [Alphaproteobacteria bacterium]